MAAPKDHERVVSLAGDLALHSVDPMGAWWAASTAASTGRLWAVWWEGKMVGLWAIGKAASKMLILIHKPARYDTIWAMMTTKSHASSHGKDSRLRMGFSGLWLQFSV